MSGSCRWCRVRVPLPWFCLRWFCGPLDLCRVLLFWLLVRFGRQFRGRRDGRGWDELPGLADHSFSSFHVLDGSFCTLYCLLLALVTCADGYAIQVFSFHIKYPLV